MTMVQKLLRVANNKQHNGYCHSRGRQDGRSKAVLVFGPADQCTSSKVNNRPSVTSRMNQYAFILTTTFSLGQHLLWTLATTVHRLVGGGAFVFIVGRPFGPKDWLLRTRTPATQLKRNPSTSARIRLITSDGHERRSRNPQAARTACLACVL